MLVMTIILAVLLIIANIYLLAYYCHPDDRGFGSALICKIVVIIGMILAWAQVLMLPLDVSNSRGFGGEIRMDLFWIIIYMATAVFILFIIPSLTYYYESDPDWSCWEKVKYSFWYLFATIIVVLIILLVSYAFLSTAEIPIKTINCSIIYLQASDVSLAVTTNYTCMQAETHLLIDVSFPIYVIGLMSFISWFLFVVFGGIGLPSLPLDFIYDFCTRPKKISAKELESLKEKVEGRARKIKELANECKDMEMNSDVLKKTCMIIYLYIFIVWNGERRKYNDLMRKLRAGVQVLDKEYQLILIQKDLNDSWVCQYYFGLLLGLICLLVSMAWVIHMYLFTLLTLIIDYYTSLSFLMENLFILS